MVKNIKYSFCCNFCKKSFMTMGSVIYHKRKYHNKQMSILTPKKLSKIFKPKNSFQPRHCPHCSYKSSFKYVINRHIFKHNLANHACDICQMPFINKANVSIHKNLEHSYSIELGLQIMDEEFFTYSPTNFDFCEISDYDDDHSDDDKDDENDVCFSDSEIIFGPLDEFDYDDII